MTEQCPSCGSFDVQHSRRRGWIERRILKRWLRAFRCRKCLHRFYRLRTGRNAGAGWMDRSPIRAQPARPA